MIMCDIIILKKNKFFYFKSMRKGMVYMKLSWEDVYDIFDEATIWENGHDLYWYRLMWSLMEYKHMNEYENDEERLKIFSRVFAIIRIYTDFIEECFDDSDEELVSAMGIYSSDLFRLLYSEDDVREIFTILNNELGTRRTFYSMFITCIEFSGETDNIQDILDMFDIEPEKLKSLYEEEEDSYDDERIIVFAPEMFRSDEDDEDEEDDEYESDYDEYEEYDEDDEDEYDEEYYEYDDEYEEDDDEDEEDNDENGLYFFWEEFSEDYYDTFEEYIRVLATSSMSMLNNVTPEKAAGFLYLANNMKNEIL